MTLYGIHSSFLPTLLKITDLSQKATFLKVRTVTVLTFKNVGTVGSLNEYYSRYYRIASDACMIRYGFYSVESSAGGAGESPLVTGSADGFDTVESIGAGAPPLSEIRIAYYAIRIMRYQWH